MKQSELELAEWLVALCSEGGVTLSNAKSSSLISYLHAIIEANTRLNLTRIETVSAGVRLHLLDSLMALPEIAAAPPGAVCDIGSGGGFPGVPLAIGGDRDCTLLDSVGKKATAVNSVIEAKLQNFRVRAVAERAEFHARHYKAAYAVVTARAVAPLPSLVELAAPLLSSGGVLIALKGVPDAAEVAAGDEVARLVGMSAGSTRHFILAGGTERRCIVSYTSHGEPTINLPRREGLAQHSPLA